MSLFCIALTKADMFETAPAWVFVDSLVKGCAFGVEVLGVPEKEGGGGGYLTGIAAVVFG